MSDKESEQSMAWREKFFWADCTLDGLCGVVKECCEALLDRPDQGPDPLLEAVLEKLEEGLLEVKREYTEADTSSPPGGTHHGSDAGQAAE